MFKKIALILMAIVIGLIFSLNQNRLSDYTVYHEAKREKQKDTKTFDKEKREYPRDGKGKIRKTKFALNDFKEAIFVNKVLLN